MPENSSPSPENNRPKIYRFDGKPEARMPETLFPQAESVAPATPIAQKPEQKSAEPSVPSQAPAPQSQVPVQPPKVPVSSQSDAPQNRKNVFQKASEASQENRSEAVPAPKPVPPPPPKQPPTSAGSTQPKPLPNRANLIWGVVGLFLFLFVMGMVLLTLMLSQNPQNNPLLDLLGIEPTSLKGILSSLVSGVFGFLAFICMIAGTVGVFRRLTVAKDDKQGAKSALFLMALGFGLAFAMVFIWVTLYFYISQLQIGSRLASDIITQPPQVTQLTAPVKITFSAAGIRERYRATNIIAYNWDLDGDGRFNDGNGEQIEHTFIDKGKNNGIFNVGVQVVFSRGEPIVFTRPVTIANVAPEAVFEVQPALTGFAPFEITVDAGNSRDPDGSIVSYEWDFDDDGRIDATGVTARHTYQAEGSYPVLLRVTDNNGARQTSSQTVTVSRTETARVIIDARPGFEGEAPFSVTFDGTRSVLPRTQILVYRWSFGDGTRELRGRTVQHSFREPGEYNVFLEITGEDGRKESTVMPVRVNAPKTVPKAVIRTTPAAQAGTVAGKAPFTVKFSGSDSTDADNNIIEYQWSFQDAEKIDAYGEEAGFTFTRGGEHTVTLRVIDADDNIGVAAITVSVEELGVVPKITAAPISGSAPLDVTFDASGSFVTDGSRITGYRYDFGNGVTQTTGSARQIHRYTTEGIYTAKVTVITSAGREATAEVIVSILTQPLQARFEVRPQRAQAPATFFFDSGTSTGNIASYLWNFGDSTISRLKNPEHMYQAPGEYTVKLTVQDGSNNVSFFERTVTVD